MNIDCYCDYDSPEVYRSDIRKGRKQYSCYECAGKILPGDVHEYHFGVMEGNSYSGRTCIHCVEIRKYVRGNVPCFCWAHGNMLEDATNTIDEARYRAPDETVGLKFGFLRRVVLRDRFNTSRAKVTQ